MHYIYATVSFYMMLILLVLSGQAVQAMPLLTTDDAEIVDAKHCQIELDQRFHQDQHSEVNLTPACNVLNLFELGVPLSWDDGEQRYAIQVKKKLYASERFPMAIAGSVQWQPSHQQQAQNWDFNLPVSIYAVEGFQFDLNVGLHREEKDRNVTWGVASTYEINPINQLSLEVFKTDPGKTRTQAVYHYHVLPETLSLYAAYAHPLQSDDQSWMGVGMSWVFPAH